MARKPFTEPEEYIRYFMGDDLADWGKEVFTRVESYYEEPHLQRLPHHPDDLRATEVQVGATQDAAPTVGKEKVWRSLNGNLMPCIMCGSALTLDGRLCKKCA